ncbi:hypothetical protein [Fodinibius sediminis]|nr:hypothetical protein [Fodinibius sediminis]
MDEILHKEHLLAEKAQSILEHQRELERLKQHREALQQKKPQTDKSQLSYKESLKLGEQLNQYEEELQRVEIHLQKVRRELSALKLQAKKLLPVSEVNVRVSTANPPQQTYCIKHVKTDAESQGHFEIKQVS